MARAAAACALVLALASCGAQHGSGPPRDDEASAAVAHPWPMFRGTADHVGDAADRRTPNWKIRWIVEVGERIDASAVVSAHGTVIAATRAGTVAAFAVSTGAERARQQLSGGVWSSPALAGNTLLLATDDGNIVGLDSQTLEQRWRTRAPARSFSGIAVVGSQAFLCSGATLLALHAPSGRVLWRMPLGANSFTTPAVSAADKRIVVGTRDGDVLAFDLGGRPLWHAVTTPGAHNDGSPTIAESLVVIGSNDKRLHAFSLDDGAKRWSVAGDNWVVSTAAFANGSMYVGDDGGVLRAISVADGTVSWTVQVGNDLASSPTIVGDLLIHGAHDRNVHAHRMDGTGSLALIDAGAPIYASPAVGSDGTVFIGTQRGRIIAIE